MNPAHRALRDRTEEAHRRVDALFAGFDLARRESYAAMLRAHLDALLPVEAQLTRWQDGDDLLADWPDRRRLPALIADLDALDARPHRVSAAPAGEAPDSAQIAGMLYVLEGSRHGGRFLARAMPQEFPRAYLDADQVPGKWRELLCKFESILYSPQALEIAVDAALRVFADFEAAGRKWLVEE